MEYMFSNISSSLTFSPHCELILKNVKFYLLTLLKFCTCASIHNELLGGLLSFRTRISPINYSIKSRDFFTLRYLICF